MYPLDAMETGADILFFWVARMSMLCTELGDGRTPPFKRVRQPRGQGGVRHALRDVR